MMGNGFQRGRVRVSRKEASCANWGGGRFANLFPITGRMTTGRRTTLFCSDGFSSSINERWYRRKLVGKRESGRLDNDGRSDSGVREARLGP